MARGESPMFCIKGTSRLDWYIVSYRPAVSGEILHLHVRIRVRNISQLPLVGWLCVRCCSSALYIYFTRSAIWVGLHLHPRTPTYNTRKYCFGVDQYWLVLPICASVWTNRQPLRLSTAGRGGGRGGGRGRNERLVRKQTSRRRQSMQKPRVQGQPMRLRRRGRNALLPGRRRPRTIPPGHQHPDRPARDGDDADLAAARRARRPAARR